MKLSKEFKIFWSYISKYKKEFYKVSFFAIFSSIILALIPFIYGKLIDVAQTQPTATNLILSLLGIWFLINISNSVFSNLVNRRGSFLAIDLYTDLICRVSFHLMRLPLSFHREKKIGEIITKIERAADRLHGFVDQNLFWSLPQILTAVLGILFLFFIEWRLAIGVSIIFVGYAIITISKTEHIIVAQRNLSAAFEDVGGNLYDAIFNVQTIKSSAAEDYQEKRIKADYKVRLDSIFKRFSSLWNSLLLQQQIFYSTGFFILFVAAVFLLVSQSISVGKFIMFFGYLNLASNPLRMIGWSWQNFKNGMATIKRVENLMEEQTEDYNGKGKIIKNLKGKIQFKNIYFKYKEKPWALENINLSVLPGQKIALVGGSGEGKTTLVDLISLYFKPQRGKILIDGIDARKLNLKFLRDNIAYVPQEIILFNETIKDNIKFGNQKATDQEVVEAAKIANAHDFIERFPNKYEQMVGERGIKLSAGQRQRIAIARAVIRNPKILILDEATSSLDSKTEKLVQKALEKLMKNRTTFIIAHRLSTIRLVDKILVLKKGRIIEEGTHEELLEKKGAFFEFYSLQFPPNIKSQIHEKEV
ncbi:MAG: ABC transporter ATP-binding protein [bacterium]|nr:ABC transporter ATP-binding protein [bacterium]